MFEPVLTRNVGVTGSERIDVYLARGGYQALNKALTQYEPGELINMIKQSGLRGRGGAGFPAGLKWGFMPHDAPVKYVCINTDEGEPGTFKDRVLIEEDPHQVIEGAVIASYAVGAHRAFVYIRGEFFTGVKRWVKAIADAYQKGFLGKNILGSGFDLDLSVHRGAGAYICGEETAMIASLEGYRGHPRHKPPYPAECGLFGKPTLVHNVETLCNVPHIVMHGPAWFRSMGTEESAGPKIFSVSGHVNRPGNYEMPLGTPLRQIIAECGGGVRGGKGIKSVIPGGASTPMLTAEQVDQIDMDFESLVAAGSMLGTGAIIVMDEDTCMVDVARRIASFFMHESCGLCTPCRVGTKHIHDILSRIELGQGGLQDLDLLERLFDSMLGKTFCPMGDAVVAPLRRCLALFREDFQAHIRSGACPMAVSA